MWGLFGEAETDFGNFGKCVNPTNRTIGGVTAPFCNGSNNGAKTVHPVNGNQGYIYQWWIK